MQGHQREIRFAVSESSSKSSTGRDGLNRLDLYVLFESVFLEQRGARKTQKRETDVAPLRRK